MNRLTLTIGALLFALPILAQRRHSTHKSADARQLVPQRLASATKQIFLTDSMSQERILLPVQQPDLVHKSITSFATGSAVPISQSTAPRTSPEALIQPQQIIRSYYVDLAYNKTVSIIFPTAVRSVDLGSRNIIADKAMDVENVLKVKAAQIGFNETNFSVMTADGTFYSFVVNYNETPGLLALNLAGSNFRHSRWTDHSTNVSPDSLTSTIQFAGVTATQSDIVYMSDRVLRHQGKDIQKADVDRMRMQLRSVYVDENVLYFRVAIDNRSNLNYDIDYLRCFVIDGKTAKLTSRQEIELHPIYVHNEAITTVRGHQQVERVYAFQRFTIPNDKQVLLQLGEENGGRNLALKLPNKVIMKAKKL